METAMLEGSVSVRGFNSLAEFIAVASSTLEGKANVRGFNSPPGF